MNHKTSTNYFHRLREIIAYELDFANDEMFSGEIEVDESYFSGVRKGKRERVQVAKPLYLAYSKGVARLPRR